MGKKTATPWRATAGLFAASLCAGTASASRLTPAQAALVERAGNASVEAERHRHLLALSGEEDLDAALRSDLAVVLDAADLWAGEREHWSAGATPTNGRFLNGYLRADWPAEIPQMSPLYPLWCLYRGRALIQLVIQDGNLAEDPVARTDYYGTGRRLLGVARDAYPRNRIVRMYLGEHVPWPPLHSPDPRAPEWANLQREVIGKMAHVIRWWIRERQAPDGQFGGGWGDDVEMWRVWLPVLIGFEDPEIIAAQRRLAEGLFATGRMEGGYSSFMTDVEHTAEDSGDTVTAMMHLAPDDPTWSGRARRIFDLFRDLWTGRNLRGGLMFRSTYFTAQEVLPDPDLACDTVYHPRAVQPALLYWQRSGDAEMTELFADWMRTWVAAAAGAERGKPRGVLPSAIHWPDGGIGGTGPLWWDPRNHDEPALYRWPSAMSMMTRTLLLTAYLTGDASFLEPVRTMAAMRAEYLRHPAPSPEPGSAAWCASKLGFLAGTLAKYRFLTGDARFDHLLEEDADGYVRLRLGGGRDRLVADLRRQADAYAVNREAFCEEVRWTDRLLDFRSFANDYLEEPLPEVRPDFLYRTLTGDPGGALYFPMNAVRWLTRPDDLAALVTDSGSDRLVAELFHFGPEARTMGARLFLLARGRYRWSLTCGGDLLESSDLAVDGKRAAVRFALPPQSLCTLTVRGAAD